jgi:alpha-tubulin suppressor-like RCC1 family protein
LQKVDLRKKKGCSERKAIRSSPFSIRPQILAVGQKLSWRIQEWGYIWLKYSTKLMLNNAKGVLFFAFLVATKSSFSQTIAAGERHTVFVCPSGQAMSCGESNSGQLADTTYLNFRTWPLPLPLPTGIKMVSGGNSSTHFLLSDSTVWNCGSNFNGQLGDGTTTDTPIPVQASGLTNVIAVAGSSGGAHTLFLKGDGTVWACGANWYGQLGNGTTTDSHIPVQVPISGIIAVSASVGHTLFLKSDGTVWACGHNYVGELGDGTTTDRHTPVQCSGLTGITAIAAGGYHSLFLKSNGTVMACGGNGSGHLGIGSYTTQLLPVNVLVVNGIVGISTGLNHSLFVKNDGTVWACGSNQYGQLGDGTNTNRTIPVQLSLTGITKADGEDGHSLFLKSDSTVWSCGYNDRGQLGNRTLINSNTPALILGLASIVNITGGASFSIFLKNDSTVLATGNNSVGQCTSGMNFQNNTPSNINAGPNNIVKVAAGRFISLFLESSGTVWWTRGYYLNPVPSVTGIVAADFSNGNYGSCLMAKNDGTAWVWGNNDYGQLGDTNLAIHYTSNQVAGLSGITAVAAGDKHSLFLKSDGTVYACGNNGSGQLGDGTFTERHIPFQIPNLTNVVAIDACLYTSLFLKSDGTVWACGSNYFGQLGDANTSDRNTPFQTTLSNIASFAAGNAHTLFLKNDGTVWASGNNYRGQLGDGTTINRTTPIQITNMNGTTSVYAGNSHSLFVKSDGTIWACGWNLYGQLGDGTTTDRSIPVQVHNLCSVCAVPTVQASNITFSNVTSNSMIVSWTNGNGSRRIVRINTTNNFTNPINGADYITNPVYLGGEQTVYNGIGNSVTVTGLLPHTNYWFRAYEASCSATNSLYLTSTATGNPKKRLTPPNSSQSPNRPEAEEDIEESFAIYPNPAHGGFTVSGLQAGVLDIYNIVGEKVYSQQIPSPKLEIRNEFSPGVYLVKVTSESGVGVKRLVIE